jgi:hypothetical protein
MTRGAITTEWPSLQSAVDMIAGWPGMTTMEIARRRCWSYSFTLKVLGVARRAALIDLVPCDDETGPGRGRIWFAARDLPAARNSWEEVRKERADILHRKELERLKKHKKQKADGFGSRMVHRKIKAGSTKPLPFVVRAPCSVFALGGGE